MKVKTVPFIEHASGKLVGTDYVLKTIRGKVFLSRKPKPSTKPVTKPQRQTRSKFKDAALFAKTIKDDDEKKAFYTQRAIKLKLPNAYTAALADYMRPPKIASSSSTNQLTIEIQKKDFNIISAELSKIEFEVRVIEPTQRISRRLNLLVKEYDATSRLKLKVTDYTGQHYHYSIADGKVTPV